MGTYLNNKESDMEDAILLSMGERTITRAEWDPNRVHVRISLGDGRIIVFGAWDPYSDTGDDCAVSVELVEK